MEMREATALRPKRRARAALTLLATPAFGPLLVLLLFGLIFSLTTRTFLATGNLSVVLQQSVVIGTLAIGQTMIILTAGIDLAVGSVAVLGTIIAGSLVNAGFNGFLVLAVTLMICTGVGATSGVLVSRVRLPPFIVTLGMLGIITAATRLISRGGAFPVDSELMSWTGTAIRYAGAALTYGVLLMFVLYALAWVLLTQTGWGRHVYAIGNDPEAARLVGIPVKNRLFQVYALAGLIYGIGAWFALGRIPNADPNALQWANLQSITAVVIGGTSLFGGRGNVLSALVGTVIVTVLRNGLTLMEIDPLWQDLVTGILVIAAVALDQWSREQLR